MFSICLESVNTCLYVTRVKLCSLSGSVFHGLEHLGLLWLGLIINSYYYSPQTAQCLQLEDAFLSLCSTQTGHLSSTQGTHQRVQSIGHARERLSLFSCFLLDNIRLTQNRQRIFFWWRICLLSFPVQLPISWLVIVSSWSFIQFSISLGFLLFT